MERSWQDTNLGKILPRYLPITCQDYSILPYLPKSCQDCLKFLSRSCQDLSWFFFTHISCWAVFFGLHKYRYNEPWSNQSHISQYCQYSIMFLPWYWKILSRWSCQDPTMILAKILSQSCQDSIIILQWSWTTLPRFHHDLTKIISKSCQDPIVILPWSWRILARFHHDLTKIPLWSFLRSYHNLAKILS
jgi:hypothetical protein